MNFWKLAFVFLSGLVACTSLNVSAESLLTEKHRFSMSNFKTFGGKTIAKVDVGWESYGKLNADKSNVVLITHYFSGTSHAAGKYNEADANAGYWDAIIGPGKAIDTNRFFVISSDTLANANAHDPNVITTGPASIDPATNKPYGLTFPVLTIRDFVNVQKALLESLGINKLYAVIGPSMGSLQAIEWASAYPDRVDRLVSVIGMAQADAWATAALEQWALPIRLDPAWNNGNYYGAQAPIAGITGSLALVTQQAMHPMIFNRLNAQHNPLESEPLESIQGQFKVNQWLMSRAAARAEAVDANHLLYLIRACQLFITGHGNDLEQGLSRIEAKTLFLPGQNDLLLMPYMAKLPYGLMKEQGKDVSYREIEGEWGHLDGVYGVQQQAALIADFLAK